MTQQDIEIRVRELLSTILEKYFPAGELVSRTSEPKWNSLKHVELIFALEDEFGVHFSEKEMTEICDLDTLIKVIGQRAHAA